MQAVAPKADNRPSYRARTTASTIYRVTTRTALAVTTREPRFSKRWTRTPATRSSPKTIKNAWARITPSRLSSFATETHQNGKSWPCCPTSESYRKRRKDWPGRQAWTPTATAYLAAPSIRAHHSRLTTPGEAMEVVAFDARELALAIKSENDAIDTRAMIPRSIGKWVCCLPHLCRLLLNKSTRRLRGKVTDTCDASIRELR